MKGKNQPLLSAFISLLLFVLLSSTLSTQGWALSDDELGKRVKQLSNELRCPTCQGLSVNDSEAGFSVQIRNKVEEMMVGGASNQEIKDYFVERYGVWILRSPPKEGFNWLLWILPGVAIAGGLCLVYIKSKSWVNRQRSESQDFQPLTSEEEKVLEKDLKRFQES